MLEKHFVLFSIPIYAISKKNLAKKAKRKMEKYMEKYNVLYDEQKSELVEKHLTFPYRVWKYNHIVGYIEISAFFNDVYFNTYLPYTRKKHRYHWDTKKKTFVLLEILDAPHFPIFDDESNDEIFKKIRNRLEEITKNTYIIPRSYYVDMEQFNTISKYLDIKSLLKDIREINIQGENLCR